jgi:hypothetical protein
VTPIEAIVLIESAKSGTALFRDHDYRELLLLVHPDRFEPSERDRADAAARKLGDLRAKGKAPAIAVGKWTISGPLAKGDVADLYSVSSAGIDGVLKIARSPDDNDLMEAEASALRDLATAAGDLANFRKYVPELLDSFEASGRRANVLTPAAGYLSLADIEAQLPASAPFRHCVWMMNRLLSALGFIHRKQHLHGGITPDHLLYQPKSHGLMLVGWCGSVPLNGAANVPIIAEAWRSIYAPEILHENARKSRTAHPASDIYMAAKSIMYVAESIPKRFDGLFQWCTAGSPASRPVDAWVLQEKWVALAKEEYGDPKYIELVLPKH